MQLRSVAFLTVDRKISEEKLIVWTKGQAMYVYRNIEASSCNHCCSVEVISFIYSACLFVAWLSSMEYACAILSHVSRPALQVSSILSRKRHSYKKSYWILNICFLFFTTFVRNVTHSNMNLARYDKNVNRSSC
jgi:hypothetical protein